LHGLGRRRRGESVAGGERAHRGAASQQPEPAVVGDPDVGGQRGAVHRQVADLARRPGRAAVQLAAEDGGQAEPAAEPHQDEVIGAGVFTQVYIVIGALGQRDEYNLGIYEYATAFQLPPAYGLASALAFVLTIILLIITVGYVRSSVKEGALV
jgi:hypothetical protein